MLEKLSTLEKYLYLYQKYLEKDYIEGKEKEYVTSFISLLNQNDIKAVLEERENNVFLALVEIKDEKYQIDCFKYADIINEKRQNLEAKTFIYSLLSYQSVRDFYREQEIKNNAIIIDKFANTDFYQKLEDESFIGYDTKNKKYSQFISAFHLEDRYEEIRNKYQELLNNEYKMYQIKNNIIDQFTNLDIPFNVYMINDEIPKGTSLPYLISLYLTETIYPLKNLYDKLKNYSKENNQSDQLELVENKYKLLINTLDNIQNNSEFVQNIVRFATDLEILDIIQNNYSYSKLIEKISSENIYIALENIFKFNNDSNSFYRSINETIYKTNERYNKLFTDSPFQHLEFSKIYINKKNYDLSSYQYSHFINLKFRFKSYDDKLTKKVINTLKLLIDNNYFLHVIIDNTYYPNYDDNSNKNLKAIETFLNEHSIHLYVDGGIKNDYTLDEYINADKKLDQIVSFLKKFNFSPLENIFAILLIVGEKDYQLSDDDFDKSYESRDLISIINGKYRVCTGYANEFNYLCREMGITSFVQLAYILEEGNENILNGEAHSNNIVYIKDDKYHVDGLYYFDPTWDAGQSNDFTGIFYSFLPLIDSRKFKESQIKVVGSTALFYEKVFGNDVLDYFYKNYNNVNEEADHVQLLYPLNLYQKYVDTIEKYKKYILENSHEFYSKIDELLDLINELKVPLSSFDRRDTYQFSLLLSFLYLGYKNEVKIRLKKIKNNDYLKEYNFDYLTSVVNFQSKECRNEIKEKLNDDMAQIYLAICIANVIFMKKMKRIIHNRHIDKIGEPIPLDTLKEMVSIVFNKFYSEDKKLLDAYFSLHINEASSIYKDDATNALIKENMKK